MGFEGFVGLGAFIQMKLFVWTAILEILGIHGIRGIYSMSKKQTGHS